ncbi:MAG: hypothetical protein FJZ04_01310 [Candidatus Moranbacteria bacterium]|nr:hypothetical protein [Candidatus Moranbacteria bacterium]
MTLSPRQQQILTTLIEEYVRTANPVGSEELSRLPGLSTSPATIRKEMAELERKGFLYQPHTSAGRIPTDRGYRFFVNQITQKRLKKINFEEQKLFEEELIKLKLREKMLARTLARLLSAFSHNLAITGLLEEKKYFESGIKDLISQPDWESTDEICQIAEMLDYLDENIEKLSQKLRPRQIKTFIGKEHMFTQTGDCAIVISRCTLPQGANGIVAILGPKRMEYKRNISLIKQVTNFFDTSK